MKRGLHINDFNDLQFHVMRIIEAKNQVNLLVHWICLDGDGRAKSFGYGLLKKKKKKQFRKEKFAFLVKNDFSVVQERNIAK